MMDARGVDAGRGALKTIGRIVKNEGWGSLYAGLHISLLRVVPNCESLFSPGSPVPFVF